MYTAPITGSSRQILTGNEAIMWPFSPVQMIQTVPRMCSILMKYLNCIIILTWHKRKGEFRIQATLNINKSKTYKDSGLTDGTEHFFSPTGEYSSFVSTARYSLCLSVLHIQSMLLYLLRVSVHFMLPEWTTVNRIVWHLWGFSSPHKDLALQIWSRLDPSIVKSLHLFNRDVLCSRGVAGRGGGSTGSL